MVAPVAEVVASTRGELTSTTASTPSTCSVTSKMATRLSVSSSAAVRGAKPGAEIASV